MTLTDPSALSSEADSIGATSWLEEIQQSLPAALDSPCKLSLGLDVKDSAKTRIKLSLLLDCLKSQ